MGVDERLIGLLAAHASRPRPPTPAAWPHGRPGADPHRRPGPVDVTVGSALDIFGGGAAAYDEVVAFHADA